MAHEGVPLLVRIGLKLDARGNTVHDFPDWTQLPLQRERGERHEDHVLVRWHYDNKVGHDQDALDSPVGIWLGLLVVTRVFATEALVLFPGRVTRLTEAQARTFWDERCMADMPAQRIHGDYLVGLQAARALYVARGKTPVSPELVRLDAIIDKALDENDPAPGVRAVREKTWDGMKAARGIVIPP